MRRASKWMQLPKDAVMVSEDISYTWGRCTSKGVPGHEHTVHCLYVFHWCDHHMWVGRVGYDKEPWDYVGWAMAGVSAHTLVQKSPLTLTASVYWPDCCGTHGFITNGLWRSA